MSKLGDVIDGKYEILKEVGRGGMSIVYLAMDNRLNKQWAVKEVRRKGSNSQNQIVVQSLLAEANLMKKLDHPHLPRIVDIIENGQTIYIVMDYVEGESLDKLLKSQGAQDQEAVIEWGKQLAEVLDYLHTREPAIIYRDMKPANVMLRPDGSVKLLDFGIAREYKENNTEDTVSLGTKGYAAPEQFGGMGQTDARTDVYCLGVTLYHLVTGKNPCEPPYEIMPIRTVNPKLSSGLEVVIQKCTQTNPDERFQSCAEVLYALNHLEEFDGRYRKRQKRKLNGFIVSLASSFLMALAGVGCLMGYNATLSQTVGECLEVYGAEAVDGGNLEKLTETLTDIGKEINEEALYSLLSNYLDVTKNRLNEIAAENVTTEGVLVQSETDDIATLETKVDNQVSELFADMDQILRDYVADLSVSNQGKIWYEAGTLYMNYYKLEKSRYDAEYINQRYEEAFNRYKRIESGLSSADMAYVDSVVTIGEVIADFNEDKAGLSGISTLTDEDKNNMWKKMQGCIDFENKSDYEKQLNLLLIISNILEQHKTEYVRLTESSGEISAFCESAVAYLTEYEKTVDTQTDATVKLKHAKEKLQTVYDFIANSTQGGTSE